MPSHLQWGGKSEAVPGQPGHFSSVGSRGLCRAAVREEDPLLSLRSQRMPAKCAGSSDKSGSTSGYSHLSRQGQLLRKDTPIPSEGQLYQASALEKSVHNPLEVYENVLRIAYFKKIGTHLNVSHPRKVKPVLP